MTDNRNRTVAEIRNVFTRGGGSLGEAGCVAWLFDSRGIISVQPNGADPDEVALKAIDAGADDFRVDDDGIEIYTEPAELETVRTALNRSKSRSATPRRRWSRRRPWSSTRRTP